MNNKNIEEMIIRISTEFEHYIHLIKNESCPKYKLKTNSLDSLIQKINEEYNCRSMCSNKLSLNKYFHFIGDLTNRYRRGLYAKLGSKIILAQMFHLKCPTMINVS